MGVDSIRRSFGRAQTERSGRGREEQSPAGRSSAGDGVRTAQREGAAGAGGGGQSRVASHSLRGDGGSRGRRGMKELG